MRYTISLQSRRALDFINLVGFLALRFICLRRGRGRWRERRTQFSTSGWRMHEIAKSAGHRVGRSCADQLGPNLGRMPNKKGT